MISLFPIYHFSFLNLKPVIVVITCKVIPAQAKSPQLLTIHDSNNQRVRHSSTAQMNKICDELETELNQAQASRAVEAPEDKWRDVQLICSHLVRLK